MSIVLNGIGIGGGIAIGRAHLISHNSIDVVHYPLEPHEVPAELVRFDEAIRATRKELEMLWGSIPENAPAELGAFLSLHIMLLNDATISREPLKVIDSLRCNAEWALKTQSDQLVAQFEDIEEQYLRERKQDVLQVVERIFKNDAQPRDIAAIIIEPVQGEGGFYVNSPAFMQRLRALCDEHGILLIADEVQTGAGRTGTFFACEQLGIVPDLTTFAKSVGGGFPISGVCGKAEIMDVIAPGGLGGTYAGSPIACAAALATTSLPQRAWSTPCCAHQAYRRWRPSTHRRALSEPGG